MRTITTSDFMRIFRLDQYGPEVQEAIYKIINLGPATHETNGLLTAEDKAKLDALGIEYDTTANWALRTDYVPAAGVIIVYSDHATVGGSVIPGVKVGDGMTLVGSLAFVGDDVLALAASKYTKPAGGIPKADLDSGVQGSLDSADASVTAIAGIRALIPNQASDQNQLADKDFVNSSISTATATYRGAYNLVTDLSLTTSATEGQIVAALASAISGADNNDYAFVQVPTADATPTQIDHVDRYKFNGTAWSFEYALNNSGFTAEQWAALNSGITSGLVTKLSALPTNSELQTLLNGKASTSDLTAHTGNGDIHVTAQQKEAWTAKQDAIGDLAQIRSGAEAGASAAAALDGKTAAGILDEAAGQQPKTESKAEQAFIFRKNPATIKAKAFKLTGIYGKTLAWNQLADCSKVSASSATASNKTTNGFDGTADAGSAEKRFLLGRLFINPEHKYYVRFDYTSNINFNIQSVDSDSLPAASVLTRFSKIGARLSVAYTGVYWYNYDTTSVAWDLKVRNMICVDLTQMFGAGNEPSTVAEFEALYPGYHAYNPGAPISNDAAAIKTVGFNKWDERQRHDGYFIKYTDGKEVPDSGSSNTGYVPVLPDTDYYFKQGSTNSQWGAYYDRDKNYISGGSSFGRSGGAIFHTPANCHYIRVTILRTDPSSNICINISDPAKNGTYEPYWSKSLPLGLGDFWVHDAQGNPLHVTGGLKSAGDVYDEIVGNKYIRRVGEVDLGALDWNIDDGYQNRFFFANLSGSGVPIIVQQSSLSMVDSSLAIVSRYAMSGIFIGHSDYSVGGGRDRTAYIQQTSVNDATVWIQIRDSDFDSSDAAAFKTAMSGVMLYYELAEPETYVLDEPLVLTTKAGTTEERISPNADGISAPMVCDMTYEVVPDATDDVLTLLQRIDVLMARVAELESNA